MERNSITFYRSFHEAIKLLPKDVQAEVYSAIMEYGFNGVEPEDLRPVARSLFTLIKPLMDANNARYENGRKGGARARTERTATKNGADLELDGSEAEPDGNQTVTKGEPKPDQTVTKAEPNDNQTVTKGEANKDKEEDIEESTPDGVPKKAGLSSPPHPERIDYGKLKDYFNSRAAKAGIPGIKTLTDARKAAIRARVAQYGKKAVETVMGKVTESDFLRGKNDRDWQATFEWIFNQRNFTRILEGVYDNKSHQPGDDGDVNDYWRNLDGK